MNDQIKIQLVKLTDGGRLLRLSDMNTGLCLEQRLAPELPVIRQQARLRRELELLISRLSAN
jgi:hypothetical protein